MCASSSAGSLVGVALWPLTSADATESPSMHSNGRSLVLNTRALSEDAVSTNPAVDETTIVADLKPRTLNGLHDVQILVAPDLTEDDVADFECGRIDRHDRAQLTRFDAPAHRAASRPKRNGLTRLKPGDVMRR